MPLALFVALLLVAYLPGLEQPGNVPRQALLLAGAPALCAWYLARRAMRPAPVVVGLALAVALAGALGLALVPAPERAAVLFDLGVLVALLALAVVASGTGDRARDDLARGVLWGVLAVSALGVAQAFLGWDLPGIVQARPPAATFVNRNVAAEALVVAVPLAFGRAFGRAFARAFGGAAVAVTARTRWLASLAAAGGGALLVATRARGAWLAAAVAWSAACWLAWRAHRRRVGSTRAGARADTRTDTRANARADARADTRAANARSDGTRSAGERTPGARAALVLPILALLLAAFLPLRSSEPLPTAMSTLASVSRPAEGSGEVRLALWRNTAALIGDRPWLGVGAGRWSVVYPLFHRRAVDDPRFSLDVQPERAENDWLEWAADLGLPAAACLSALFAVALWRAARRGDAPLAAGLGGAMLHALVAFPLHSPASAGLAFLAAGCAFGDGERRPWPRAAAVLCAAIALGAAAVAALSIAAQRELAAALDDASSCARRIEAAHRVLARAPWARREAGIAAALVFGCEKDPQRSLDVLVPALARQPHSLNLLLMSAARELRANRPEAAEALAGRALEVDDRLGRAWLLLAMAREARGDARGADSACGNARRWYVGSEADAFCGARAGPSPAPPSSPPPGPHGEH